MVVLDVPDRLNALLDADDPVTVGTSMRLPAALRDAAAIAVDELGPAREDEQKVAPKKLVDRVVAGPIADC